MAKRGLVHVESKELQNPLVGAGVTATSVLVVALAVAWIIRMSLYRRGEHRRHEEGKIFKANATAWMTLRLSLLIGIMAWLVSGPWRAAVKLGSNLWSTDSLGQHLRDCIGNGTGWVKSIALASAFGHAWRFRHIRDSKVRLWRFGEGQTLRNKLRRIRRRLRRPSSRSMRALRKALDATWCRLRAGKRKKK